MRNTASSPFTLRSDADLLATFRKFDQHSVVFPRYSLYPLLIEDYYAWTEPSGAYTYLVYKQSGWELPLGLVFQRNGSGSALSPAGMCDWCHSYGPSSEIGLMSADITPRQSGGTWLCKDLDCLQKIEEQTGLAPKAMQKHKEKLFEKMGKFYQRVRLGHED